MLNEVPKSEERKKIHVKKCEEISNEDEKECQFTAEIGQGRGGN